MRIPQFLKFEFDDSGPSIFPTAVAWSLTDGRIKTVILMPEDDWLPEDPADWQVDHQHFKEQGAPAIEVIQEMNEDLEETTVYTDGLDPDDELIEVLFETLNQGASFQVAPVAELLNHRDSAELTERYSDLILEEGLDPQIAESGVYALLLLAREEGLMDNIGDESPGL